MYKMDLQNVCWCGKRTLVTLLLSLAKCLVCETNLGTINTIENGMATIKECQADIEEDCLYEPFEELKDILNFTTTNQCLAEEMLFQEHGIQVPECPQSPDDIKGLDNTYPTGGIFALYASDNRNFIYDFVQSYLDSSPVGRFNLVLPIVYLEELKKDEILMNILNSPRVNIINVKTFPSVERWMQDSFQFVSLNGKPALYQLEHSDESGDNLKDRLACELAKKCDIPYYIPPDMVNPQNMERNNGLNAGGNLEVLPGGTFYMGIRENDGEHARTDIQIKYKKSLKNSGNRVLELDVSFLSVGHVDEMVSVIKTNKNVPCNYAVLIASPQKAFKIMEQLPESSGFQSTVSQLQQDYSQQSKIEALETQKRQKEDNLKKMSKIELESMTMSNGGTKHVVPGQDFLEVRCSDEKYPDHCDIFTIEESGNEEVVMKKNNAIEMSPYDEGTEYSLNGKVAMRCSSLGKCTIFMDDDEKDEREITSVPMREGGIKHRFLDEDGTEAELRCPDSSNLDNCMFFYKREGSEEFRISGLESQSYSGGTRYLLGFDFGLDCTDSGSCSRFFNNSRCKDFRFNDLKIKGLKKIFSVNDTEDVYNRYCLSGKPIEEFLNSEEYQILKNQSHIDEEILLKNKERIVRELKQTTGCQSPVVIDIPVFFRSGSSFVPNLVNGVVETPPNSPSKVILPKTYFRPFDNYVKEELEKYGVQSVFVHDLEYHLNSGGVHCGTNAARICRPRSR